MRNTILELNRQGQRPKERIKQQGVAYKKDEVLEALRPLLQLGYSVTNACGQIGIAEETVHVWLKKNPALLAKVRAWQEMASNAARHVLVKSIVEDKDQDNAKWWLERKQKAEFSQRQEVTGEDGGPIVVIDAGKDPYKSGEINEFLKPKNDRAE